MRHARKLGLPIEQIRKLICLWRAARTRV
ncbi:hypothetical protein [Corticibacter populi]